jgi:hypothetical protein
MSHKKLKADLTSFPSLLAAYLPCPVPTKFMQSGLHGPNKYHTFNLEIDLDKPDEFIFADA